MTRTSTTLNERKLRDLLGYEDDEDISERKETHSGAWIKDGAVWRWYQADGVE